MLDIENKLKELAIEKAMKVIDQLRADKRELVTSLEAMTKEYRAETTQKFFQAPPWLNLAESLIKKHGGGDD